MSEAEDANGEGKSIAYLGVQALLERRHLLNVVILLRFHMVLDALKEEAFSRLHTEVFEGEV